MVYYFSNTLLLCFKKFKRLLSTIFVDCVLKITMLLMLSSRHADVSHHALCMSSYFKNRKMVKISNFRKNVSSLSRKYGWVESGHRYKAVVWAEFEATCKSNQKRPDHWVTLLMENIMNNLILKLRHGRRRAISSYSTYI